MTLRTHLRIGTTLGAALALLFLLPGCVDDGPRSTPPTGSVRQAIQGGVEDTTNKYAVGICRGPSAGSCRAICSGALILPNVIATARHCVDSIPTDPSAKDSVDCKVNPEFGARKSGTLWVTTNPTLAATTDDAGWYKPASIEVPPDAHICGNDLALLILDTPVPDSEAKPVTPGVQYLMWDPAADFSVVFTAIGYGNAPPAGAAGTRRRKELISVLCIPGGRPSCPADFNPKEFTGGDGTCSGDSGSSAFEKRSYESGKPVSFGVLSRGGETDAGDCIGSQYTRFDQHRDFVIDVAKKASAGWTLYPEPPWTTPKPRPVVDAGVKPPTGALIGDPCTKNSECTDGLCVDDDNGALICSRACVAGPTSTCPAGLDCRRDACRPPAKPVAVAPSDGEEDGCSTAGSAKTARNPWAWLGAAALGLGLWRARTRRRGV